jgi:hypothetical protein
MTRGRAGRAVNDVLAFAVEPGWEWADIIRETAASSRRLLYYADGTVRFEHRCDRGDRGVIICAPVIHMGPVDPSHLVTRNETRTHENPKGQPTITPSIHCPDCGTHGFIKNGWWYDA